MATITQFSAAQGLRYGLLGLPLAFVALPLYVILPNHYAREFGVPLATLGLVLLLARLLDAFVDPLIGRFCDRLFARSIRAVLGFGAVCALVLAAGFAGLFFPPTRDPAWLVAWSAVVLAITYAAYSGLSVAHQSWGAMLGGDESMRSKVVGWREGLGLIGVVLASVAPLLLGLPATVIIFWVLLLTAWWSWAQATTPVAAAKAAGGDLWLPFRRPAFRRLLAVFVLNGIASAVPATLVLFFVQDRLQAPKSTEAAALAIYFANAAMSMPLWLRLVRYWGLARSWMLGMLVAIAAFTGALWLGPGDAPLFLVVCAFSGLALGTDLALPGAMLAGVIQQAGDRGKAEGAYFGWWNFATKINLALAAGLALPLLGLFGYAPGTRSPEALSALTMAYCLLPCLFKLGACALLYQNTIHRSTIRNP